MSTAAAEASGISNANELGCVGLDVDSFKTCIIKLYGDETKWEVFQFNAMGFMERNHAQSIIEKKWSDILELGKSTYNAWLAAYHQCKNSHKSNPENWGWHKHVRKWKGNVTKEIAVNCKFHNHALSRTEFAVTLPKEHCSKWWKKYKSRLPTDTTYVEDKAYLLLCPS